MPWNPARWFIEGEVDLEYIQENLRKWGPVLAGALFGAGGWPARLPLQLPPAAGGGGVLVCTVWALTFCQQAWHYCLLALA
jgi:hypothetical protein